MKKFWLLLLFLIAFAFGSTGCIFEDVEDNAILAACAFVLCCLGLYALKCIAKHLQPDEEEQIIKALSRKA